jgi:histidine phosphotransferase ChpT
MQDPLHLAELLCARLCHDLSGPLGSLMGATELAIEDEQERGEALAVAADSAAALGRRLRLLRAAWGGESGPLDVEAFQELAEGLSVGRRVSVDLSGLDPATVFAPAGARVALNSLLLAAEGLAGSGRLAMAGSANADVLVTIEGPRASWPAGLATCLADEQAAWQAITTARSLQAPLTALIARRSGLRASLLMPVGSPAGTPPPLLLALGPPP